MMPARVTDWIHGAAQLPRVSVITTALRRRARLRIASSCTPTSAATCARVTDLDASIDLYSSGMAANAAFSRSASIRRSSVSLGSSATADPYASAAFDTAPCAS